MRFLTIPNWLHKLSHNFDSNWAPLSVVKVAGVPKRAIQPLKKASATVLARISTSGQTNLVLISRFVALCDGCSNPCKFVKTFFRNFAVIYG